MKRAVISIFLWILCLSFVVSASGVERDTIAEITIRQWITGNPPDIKNLSNTVYIIEFWATWCQPCLSSIPHLIELNNKYKDNGLLIIGLSQDKSEQKVRRFIAEHKMNYPVAIDNGTADQLGIKGYPTVVVVDHKGEIAFKGYPWDKQFDRAVEKAVNDGPPPLLTGVDLGSFENLRKSLWPGEDFASAYQKLKSFQDHSDRGKADAAGRILETLDRGISEKISLADKLRYEDPELACKMYAGIIRDYGRVEITEPARIAFEQLTISADSGRRNMLAHKR
jgi:thiol-disulfide isomerase/thioredoxin